MRVDTRPFWLRLASLLYRLCARLTPRRFRERFGAEAEDTFQDLVRDTLDRRGSSAAISTAAAACGDVARVGIVERASGWRSSLASGVPADVVQGLRIYRREPLIAGAVTLTLALICGPAVAIFAILHDVVLAPLPYPEADRLVVVGHQSPAGMNTYLRAGFVAEYRGVPGFSMVGGVISYTPTVSFDGQLEQLRAFRATAGVLSMLGVPFVAGRDMRAGEREVVVTRSFALARFGSESEAVGRIVEMRREPFTIVGVTAYRPALPGPPGVELFIPHPVADTTPVRGQRAYGQAIVLARLAPGVDPIVAREQVRAVAAAVRQYYPDDRGVPELMPLGEVVSGSLRLPLMALTGAVAMVFLIAVTSLASLILARAASRAAEVAVRLSLGASRWRLVRAWIVDGVMFALPGVAAGAWLSTTIIHYLRASLPPGIVPVPETAVMAPSLVAAATLAAITAVSFACAPAMAGLLRVTPESMRQPASGLAPLRRARTQSLLIAGQVALSIALVTSAVWLSSSLWRMLSRPIGIDPSNLVIVATRSPQPAAVQIETAGQVLRRLEQLAPDAAGRIAATSSVPGVGASRIAASRIRADQAPYKPGDEPLVTRYAVSSRYFHILEIPLLEGRYLSEDDQASPASVIVLSRSFAATWFPEGALGRFVTFGANERREIVGVVEDVHAGNLRQESLPQFYVPMTDASLGVASSYVLRTARTAASLRAEVVAMVQRIDRTATVTVMAASDAMALPLVLHSVGNRLVVALSGLALLLAILNISALSAFSVVQRTREIGIRMALGARAVDATRLVMRRGVLWIAAGLVLGGALTMLGVEPLFKQQLYGTNTGDPILLALAYAIVAGTAVLASWLPARRAASIDPAITLRAE
jgi:putative ABC transport system permease protein